MTVAPRIAKSDWKRQLKAFLPLFGHRNWIVVADSAYPAQSKPGIETIVADAAQVEVARTVLGAIAASKHVHANIYLDQELQFVAEADAPGVSRYRAQLAGLLKSAKTTTLPHEQIIARLDQAALVFRVLIIKTELSIPYTTIFLELDCGYWGSEAEHRLRQAMAASAAESKGS
ncbi:MAG: RbsD/FucU domain-containing protein [Terracidiphilus sp.]|jgi:L-fucose mutarotase/ribose pyranase (RbsD/FucU family)